MLFTNATDIVMTQYADLLPGEVVHEEGTALVWHRENGRTYLRISTGAANENFAGFALMRSMPPAFQTAVEETIVDSTGLYVLNRVPTPGQLLVKVAGVKAAQEASGTAPTAAGKVAVQGAELRLHADDIGKKVFIQYAYELTLTESRSITGDAPIGGLAANIQGSVGYIKLGTISTNLIDAAADWSDDTVLNPSLAAGGKLTIGGSGTKLTGLIIKHAPSSERGYLTVEMASTNGN